MTINGKKYDFDVKAEYVAADLVEKGKNIKEIIINPASQFKRGYKPDVLESNKFKASNENKDLENISVSREGLYDYLPEGLFHESYSVDLDGSEERSRERISRNQIEEKEARKFFLGFEREFNIQRILLEINERSHVDGFSRPEVVSLFREFWQIDDSYKDVIDSKVLHLLPLCSQLVGNNELVAACMQAVLGVPVNIENGPPGEYECPPELIPGLGEARLGIDTIVGGVASDGIPSLIINVGPLEADDIIRFLPDNPGDRLINLLIDFLLPVEPDKITNYVTSRNIQKHTFTDENYTGRLGYTTYL